MDRLLIEWLKVISQSLAEVVAQRSEMKNFGNAWGRME